MTTTKPGEVLYMTDWGTTGIVVLPTMVSDMQSRAPYRRRHEQQILPPPMYAPQSERIVTDFSAPAACTQEERHAQLRAQVARAASGMRPFSSYVEDKL